MFTSSTVYTGALGGLVGADLLCQGLAEEVGLSGTYKAWLSDSTGSPSTRFTKSTTPWVRVDGEQIAGNWEELIGGSLDAAPGFDEKGDELIPTALNSAQAWTGTITDGTASTSTLFDDCDDWGFGGSGFSGARGVYTAIVGTWTFSGATTSCSNTRHLYCFEQ